MALKELRGATRGWIFKIFVALLIASFGAWGVQDIFKTSSGKGVAQVAGEWITTGEFQERLHTAVDRYNNQNGKPLNLEEVKASGIPHLVLNQMIYERVLAAEARRLNLATHDESLSHVIRAIPSFQSDGQFDELAYHGALRQAGMNPAGFETALRADIMRAQLLEPEQNWMERCGQEEALMGQCLRHGAIAGGGYMPRGLVEVLLASASEMREVSYVVLDPALAGEIPAPDKAALEKVINADKDAYSTPELRTFVALIFRPADFAAEAGKSITDTELMAQYKANPASYTVPEVRVAREISFPTETDARAALQAIESRTKTFEEIGRARGLKDADVVAKIQTRKDIPDPEVANAVYEAKAPGLVGPVNGALAWSIAEVKGITPERLKTFDEVKEEIRTGLAKTGAEDLTDNAVKKFEDARAGGETFEEISKKLNVPLVKFEGVNAQGLDRNGKAVVTGPEAPDLLKAAFQAEQGTDSDIQSLSQSGQFVVRLDSVAPPAVRPFAEIEAQARAAYEAKERATRLKAKTDALIAAHAHEGLGAVAAELGVTPATLPAPLKRKTESDVLSPSLVKALFKAKPQTLVEGDSTQSGKMVIATVLKVDRPAAGELTQALKQVGPQIDTAAVQDVADAFVNAARSKLGVKIDQRALDQATSNARL